MSSSWNTYIIKNISSGGGGGGACVPFSVPHLGGGAAFLKLTGADGTLSTSTTHPIAFSFLIGRETVTSFVALEKIKCSSKFGAAFFYWG